MGHYHTVHAVLGIVIRNKDQMNYIRDVIDEGDPDRFQKPHSDITVLIENISGRHIVIGELLASFNQYGEGEFTEISTEYIDSRKTDVRLEIGRNFPALPVENMNVRFFMFSDFY
ncbi:hypothetical protein PHIM7_164 [Sinorhizobium phage phiM7]|uniref:Uncharacterized protein n=2 Tax=Emdodecavirus TaxID=1980937 RepID=S5MB64_9CAUD|nr:hypothetical protein AB690_gp334 [Sinorhizobium phage phiM12]YP_009601289.1 hypothetical protein FDH46_gp314 [Sinorhizobium phage phiM7]AGR47868.1 hypothetical protein SmphiM12_236 [Sinorhizobium phage phiM12]AKF12710.1 hypothetical protein PHIM7_164 [Sinorhizobium phage phiM7]AKF13069.1 hypothetical protein PHIM19_164 [Sinorhizobium phage phiM19]